MKFLLIQCLIAFSLTPTHKCGPLNEITAKSSFGPPDPEHHNNISNTRIDTLGKSSEHEVSRREGLVPNYRQSNKNLSHIPISSARSTQRRIRSTFQSDLDPPSYQAPTQLTPTSKKPSDLTVKVLDRVLPDVDPSAAIRDRKGRFQTSVLEESILDYPSAKIRELIEQVPPHIREAFNVGHQSADENLTERMASNIEYGGYPTSRHDELCRTRTKEKYPQRGWRMNGRQGIIINEEGFRQSVTTEECLYPDEQCPILVDSLPDNIVSYCHQKFAYMRFYFMDGDKLSTDLFRYQSCCTCRARHTASSEELRKLLKSDSESNISERKPAITNATTITTTIEKIDNPGGGSENDGKSRLVPRVAKSLNPSRGPAELNGRQKASQVHRDSQKSTMSPPKRNPQFMKPPSSSDTPPSGSTHTIVLQEDGVYKSGE